MFPKQAEADQPNASRVGKGRYATIMGSYYHVPYAQPSDSQSPVLRVPPEHAPPEHVTQTRYLGKVLFESTCEGRHITREGPGPPGGGESICTIVAGAWSHRLTDYSQNACGKAQLGSAPSCGAASVVGTQHQRRHSPTWNCAQVLALPGAAGMATMQRKLAGKKQGVGGFLLTATIGDNYLCQPHDGATRGGARPAVAATASCPTPHATARGTLRPCGVTDSRAELVRVRSKCHRRCQPRAFCPVSSPMLPNCTTVNLTGRYEMTFSSTSTPTSVLNAKKPLYWTRPLHTAHLIVPFPPWATSCVASFLPIEYSYVDVSDSKQYSSSVKMWTTDLSQTPILHRGPHALHTSSEPQQRRLDVPACPLNDT
ncbi:uncharacterized protein LOC116945807 [Petromyzon marinus]|uniref:uncharacterized protein LOC116945807 n=1 Tax=Petromyzon marinus TaxID=7757 RepID=UPI003F72F35C